MDRPSNSTDNPVIQKVMEKFTRTFVLYNMTSFVEFVLSHEGNNAPFTQDDVQNRYADNKDAIIWVKEDIEKLEDEIDRLEAQGKSEELSKAEAKLEELSDELATLEETDEEDRIPDVMEWWLIDNWLAGRLIEEGEVVLQCEGFDFYGRQTSGQPIYLDEVMFIIASKHSYDVGQVRKHIAKRQQQWDHGKGLAKVFGKEVEDYIDYYRQLRDIEVYAHDKAESYNDGKIKDHSLDAYKELIAMKLKPLVNDKMEYLEMNWDARGYTLKLNDEISREHPELFHDLGNNVILAPMFGDEEEE